MKVNELIQVEDYEKFMNIIGRCKLTENDKVLIIRKRWDYLYQKYRPSEGHVRARREFGKEEAS